jgi:hypothetical protein
MGEAKRRQKLDPNWAKSGGFSHVLFDWPSGLMPRPSKSLLIRQTDRSRQNPYGTRDRGDRETDRTQTADISPRIVPGALLLALTQASIP